MTGLDRAVELVREGDLDHVPAFRDQVLAFCADHPDALLRTCEAAHLTGSALVVDPADGRFVLLHHRKVGRWLQPGGHADGDGDLAAVALKEAQEETGIDGLVVRLPAVDIDVHEFRAPGEPSHLHLDLRFVVAAPAGTAAAGSPPGNPESIAIRWVAEDELDQLDVDESTRRLVQRGLATLHRP
ncbi:MAG: NUDIX hydrolase [Acidimicrobiia bacterium]|nr:NUDIX hydrolase [Acidimicrobiia bacterium]